MSLRFTTRSWRGYDLHDYFLDKQKVPGVTTLLNGGLPKPALVNWAARAVAEFVADHPDDIEALRRLGRDAMVAGLKGAHHTERDTAAAKGTAVHAIAEKLAHGDTVDVPEHLWPHVNAYTKWLDEFDVQPVLIERTVASRAWQYAGTFDLYAKFGRGEWAGRTALLDLKTGKAIYGEVSLQLAAYARAEVYLDDTNTEQPLPPIDCTAVVHCTPQDCVMFPTAHTTETIDEQFKLFTHIAYVAKRVKWVDEQIGLPMIGDDT
jgi:hypothetical protein